MKTTITYRLPQAMIATALNHELRPASLARSSALQSDRQPIPVAYPEVHPSPSIDGFRKGKLLKSPRLMVSTSTPKQRNRVRASAKGIAHSYINLWLSPTGGKDLIGTPKSPAKHLFPYGFRLLLEPREARSNGFPPSRRGFPVNGLQPSSKFSDRDERPLPNQRLTQHNKVKKSIFLPLLAA